MHDENKHIILLVPPPYILLSTCNQLHSTRNFRSRKDNRIVIILFVQFLSCVFPLYVPLKYDWFLCAFFFFFSIVSVHFHDSTPCVLLSSTEGVLHCHAYIYIVNDMMMVTIFWAQLTKCQLPCRISTSLKCQLTKCKLPEYQPP